jgi:chorismate-pyruvate lyase
VTAPQSVEPLQLLLGGPDTVTHLLERITGEPLRADVLSQQAAAADAGNELGLPAGAAVTVRTAVLRGSSSGLAYVYARSLYRPTRLPAAARTELAQTSDPIGRVLATHGVALTREPGPAPDAAGRPGGVAAESAEVVWSRSYRLRAADGPVFAISEWFTRSVLDAMGNQ